MDWNQCCAGKKVLLAEDDNVNQELLKDILEQMGITLDIAKDGVEAVEKFKTGSYDLLIMDIRMPNKDGIQATREIRSLEKGNSHVPIFALSASTLESDKGQILEAGFNEFITKPIMLEELRKKIANTLLGKPKS